MREMKAVDASYATEGPNQNTLRQSIAVPANTLFNSLADGPAWKEWLGTDVEWTTPEPHGVGTTRTVTLNGQTIEEKFLTWDDGERITFRFDRCTLPMAAFAERYECVSSGASACELQWSYAFEWGGPLAPVLGRVFGIGFAAKGKRSLKKLAALLENDPSRFA